jgi:hypothetical protein
MTEGYPDDGIGTVPEAQASPVDAQRLIDIGGSKVVLRGGEVFEPIGALVGSRRDPDATMGEYDMVD